MKSKFRLLGVLSASALLSSASAQAQDAPAPEAKGWVTSANAGLTMTSGNSDTVLATIGLDSKKAWDQEEIAYGVSGGYGKNDDTRNTDFVKAFGQYNHLLNERAYIGVRADGEHDGIADLLYRGRLAVLAGYYFVKSEKTSLSFDVGPSLIVQKYEATLTAPEDSSADFAIRFGEKFEHKLTDTTRIWQTAEYVPYVEDWMDKYLITAEVGIATAISKQWDLRVVFQVNHDSAPPTGKKYTDTRLIAGTGYKF